MEKYDLDDPYLVEFIEKYKDYTYEELGDAFDELNPLDLQSYTRESEYVRSEKGESMTSFPPLSTRRRIRRWNALDYLTRSEVMSMIDEDVKYLKAAVERS
jgi:hypothetical protein